MVITLEGTDCRFRDMVRNGFLADERQDGYMGKKVHCLLLVVILSTMSLTGCTDDENMNAQYEGPISLIVYYDDTSGQIEESWNQGNQQQTTGVSISFDLAATSSTAGAIVTITFNPGDGTETIEQNVGDSGAEITYEWQTHGLFIASAGAIDSEGNTHNITIKIRVDKHITYSINSVGVSGDTMTFSMSPDNEGPLPNRVAITSSVENPGTLNPFAGGTADVTWELKDSEDSMIGSEEATIADGSTEEWTTTSQSTSEGDWTLFISADGDSVNADHDVSILYLEGSESPANPRP
jgi:hypothetical protein